MQKMLELAAFLGNPGKDYAGTRHNAGWLLAETLPFFSSLAFKEKFKGRYALLERRRLVPFAAAPAPEEVPAGQICFLFPGTFMNLSGDSVRTAAAFFKTAPADILVIHDELELPLGTASLKFGGGLGGHNGLRSVKAALGSAEFWRLRLGIGRPDERRPGQGGPAGSGQGIMGWVLSNFSPEERAALDGVLDACAGALIRALLWGPEPLLPEWRKKNLTGSDAGRCGAEPRRGGSESP